MDRAVDIAVVGGGVIGLSVAYHAACRGARVALVEAGQIGGGASGAAAGMLNAQAEAHEPGPFLDLLLRGRSRHRALAGELYETSGLDVEYVWSGTLRAARSREFEEKLKETYAWQREEGLAARWLSGEEAREMELALAPDVRAGLYLPEDGQVNSPRLVEALALAALHRAVELREATSATGFVMDGGRVTGLRTGGGEIPAGSVVLAGGWQSEGLAAELGLRLPVRPVQGEILTVTARPAPTTANVWDESCYLVPKRDGRVVIGATEKLGVRDRRPTLGGVAHLSGAAAGLVPSLAEAPFTSFWGGLRPGTPSGHPILGPVEGLEGLLLATGHSRNGVLLSAATGELISALALGEAPPADVSPFLYERHLEAAAS